MKALAQAVCTRTVHLNADVRGFRRCDYEGYYADDFNFFKGKSTIADFVPGGCAVEVGGEVGGGGSDYSHKSFTFEATIMPTETGQHTFWSACNDACHVVITRPNGRRVTVVDNGGFHVETIRRGNIMLEKGVKYGLMIYYGNASGKGSFEFMYRDPTMASFSKSFQHVLV